MKLENTFIGYLSTLAGELIAAQSGVGNVEQLAWQELSAPKALVVTELQDEQVEAASWRQAIDGLGEFEQILPYLNSDRFAVREYATEALGSLSMSDAVMAKFQQHWNHDCPEIRLRVRTAYGLYRFHHLPAVLHDNELAGLLDLTPEVLVRVYSGISQSVKTTTFAAAESKIAEDLKVILEKAHRLELIHGRFAEIRNLGLSDHWYGKQLSHSYLHAIANGYQEEIANLDGQLLMFRKLLGENFKMAEPQEPGQVVDFLVNAKEFAQVLSGERCLLKDAEEIFSVMRKDRAGDARAFLKALEEENFSQILILAPRLAEYQQQVVKTVYGSPWISVDWEVGKETMLKLLLALNDEQASDVDFYSKVIESSRRYVLNSTAEETIYEDVITELFWFYHSMADLDEAQRAIHAFSLEEVIDGTLILGTSSGSFRAEPLRQLRHEYELLLANNDHESALGVFLKVSAYFLAESKLVDLEISRESHAALLFQQAVEEASLLAGEPALGKRLQEVLDQAWALRNELQERGVQRTKPEIFFTSQQTGEGLGPLELQEIADLLVAELSGQQQDTQETK